MTKNNLLADLKYKVFRSGNPVFFYIGINTIVFVAVALFGVTYFLAGNTNIRFLDYAKEYFAFPAALPKLPFRFYTVLTYQFLHEDIFHILFNMLWLFWMGNIFIDFLKPRQFHFVYLTGGIMGALFFALAFNTFPPFVPMAFAATVIGSSASVMAIAVAVTTLLPDYTISLMFIGTVKLRYVVLVYLLIDLIGIGYANPGGSFAHLGGAFMGFIYIKMLQSGHDWSAVFKAKPKLKVVKNPAAKAGAKNNSAKVNEKEIDMILDKISKSGYDKLSKEEKETLFKASKN
ncbi:Membrane associated serine protease, rhomboid family [Pedobacter westerhofensis]|uniref:Membrane associated serine protease, rhomboid family n=1 Tax=Pedobacter westerhofensis TaxID=425512 RepID=A0A521DFB3_9SPHI|nr:rhomboid family intramembrane serine protease [Pedobacter westerhofensis]SMO70484.1 Membrane associated serine protease, rhomboid family [Pedobacter westerhofensis]